MPPPADPRCDFSYTVAANATDANKRNSLQGGGPLVVDAAHWFVSVMGHVLPAAVTGRVGITIRLAHYVAETDLHYDAAVRALCASFTLRTATLSTI